MLVHHVLLIKVAQPYKIVFSGNLKKDFIQRSIRSGMAKRLARAQLARITIIGALKLARWSVNS